MLQQFGPLFVCCFRELELGNKNPSSMDPNSSDGSDEYTDYRGRQVDTKKHGGVIPAALICGVEVLENTSFLSNSINIVTYFLMSMHYSASKASNTVTNFTETAYLLTIVGGFVGDSFLTRFTTFIFSAVIQFVGLVLLTYQARHPHLLPKGNETPSRAQAAILYTGLYAVATGTGGMKSSLAAHGADQMDHSKPHQLSSFFNWYFFFVCMGGLLTATVMVWVQQNHGWKLSFMISAIIVGCALCLFVVGFPLYKYKRPGGSPLTRIIKVLAYAAWNWKSSTIGIENHSPISQLHAREKSHDKFKFLNKALINDTIDEAQVEEAKSFLGLLPIFATTIVMSCCIAQLQTFSVQQGILMNRKLHNFTIPPPSLAVFSIVFMLVSLTGIEHLKHIYGRNSKIIKIFHPLPRIGVGLALASGSMAVAAAIEAKRRKEANDGTTLTIFWLVFQYLFLGMSDALATSGMLEFFYSEAPDRMRSTSIALSWCSNSMGYFLSTALVNMCNSVSGRYGREWLGGTDLNHARLDLFYTLLCILNFINFLLYLYCAKRY